MKLIKAGAKTGTFTLGGIRLSAVLEKSEEDLENLEKELKLSRVFKLLRAAGVIRSSRFNGIRFKNRNIGECRLKSSSSPDFSPLLDGKNKFISRIKSIGRKNFEEYFLKGGFSDLEISQECGLTSKEIMEMKEFVNDFFIYSDLQEASGAYPSAPAMAYSVVAGVEIKDGQPELAFFRREIWKERFYVDKGKLAKYSKVMPEKETGEIRKALESLSLIEKRKSTLYSLLELLIKKQKEYLIKGSPELRKPLTQKSAAATLNVHPSVVNRIISNKSIEMPWGMEIPLAGLLPSEKEINRERLGSLLEDYPQHTDRELAEKMLQIYGTRLSRRSIAQYRSELSCEKWR